ncbi:MAG TPA: TIGR01777 family oxidoreductase [Longimicrobiales bacterium]|nr:TIGR01777 family oxidoreductase [Longimicrobiales bacterium]
MRFSFSTELPDHDPKTVFDWHERPGALERLTPPWGDVEVLHRSGGIRNGAEISLRVRRGPTSFRWDLRHTDFEYGRQFRDEQVSGPLKSWSHTHRFSERSGGGTLVEDEVDVEPPLGAAGAAIGPAFLKTELARLFRFRYRRLFTDLARHAEHSERPRLTVAITGSSGLIGQSLLHFLTTGGHRVVRLLRDSRKLPEGAVYWNPSAGEIDADALSGVDAVVHLAGTSIASGRWTEARKRSIMQSRVQGTELISRTIAGLTGGPRVLVSSSAVGYYGDRGSEMLDESARPGKGFLAEVCRAWEAATAPAARAGIRVVTLRGGLVLSPAGGAIGQMLLPFKIGVGGRIGSGKQYMSWIDLDDYIALVQHALFTETLSGPVNATAPHPVPNATLTAALGRALGRPTVIPVPAIAVRAVFGQLGEEALLWGQRVLPDKATESGFSFFYEGVEDSLRFQLGREEETSGRI